MTITLSTEELQAYKSKCDGWLAEFTAWLCEQTKSLGLNVSGQLNVVELRGRITKYREDHPFPILVKI